MSWLSIFVTGGTLSIAAIAAWDSWGKYIENDPDWKITCLLGVGGLVVAILSAVNGYISEADAVAANKRIDAANTAAVEAKRLAKQEAASLKDSIVRRDHEIRSLDTNR